MLIPILVAFAIAGLIFYFRKPFDMRAAAGSWKPTIPSDPTPASDPTKPKH